MKRITLILALTVGLASQASAACYADYKAKRDGPLRLHYGVVRLDDRACGSRDAAAAAISRRISGDGWTLLNVLGIFGEDGLDQRRQSAGEFFLRY